MAGNADAARRDGLMAAGRSLASTMRQVAARYTARGAAAVNVLPAAKWDVVFVRAGRPGGEWGWDPINAWELDNNGRHPLYGDREHWYAENDKKHGGAVGLITQTTVDAGAEQAADDFGDAYVYRMFA